MDPLTSPSAAPTDAAQPTVSPSGTVTTPPLVNPVQATTDVSGLMAQYEQRIARLMSEKDKAINERNQAISQLTDLQNTHTSFQAQTQSSLTQAANAAQQAIERGKQLDVQVLHLQAESLRAQTLLEKPHLAAYAQFIPMSNDPEAVKAAVAQLEQIREDDFKRTHPLVAQQTSPTLPAQQNPFNVYQGRPNIPFSLATGASQVPGSSPAQMNPGALTDPTAAISQLFDEARKTGDSAAFERALQQAQVLSQTAIAQQMGRS